jgi:SAM-dependent methyltransferase
VARQNIYDDPDFFAGYRDLRENLTGLHELVVRPSLPELLPSLTDKRVVDLGCGGGWFCKIALDQGSRSVVGIDPSERMLEHARAAITDDRRVTFVRAFAEDVELPNASADVVVSVLALHYVADYAGVIHSVSNWLVDGGAFVMQVEHPITTCQRDLDWLEERGELHAWPVHGYHDEGLRTEHWYVDGVVKYHRRTDTILNTLIETGFVIDRVAEPAAAREAVEAAGRGASGLIRPEVLGVRATKR